MSSADEILFPTWIPQAARDRITELCASPLAIDDDTNCSLLKRLATYPAMKTDVWEKLPPDPKDFEGTIIQWAFFAYTIFLVLKQPYPKAKATKAKSREWATRLEKHDTVTNPASLSQKSYQLWEEIFKAKLTMDFYWPSLWKGDKSISPDQVLSILDQLRVFFGRIHEEYRAILADLPKVKRWNAKAPQKFFSELLSRHMSETYMQPLDTIVAALTEVAFDLPQGLAAETVRGRRRIGSAPENSKQKTR
jgi:hypothetical protein